VYAYLASCSGTEEWFLLITKRVNYKSIQINSQAQKSFLINHKPFHKINMKINFKISYLAEFSAE